LKVSSSQVVKPKEYVDALKSMLGHDYDRKNKKQLQPPDFHSKDPELLTIDEKIILDDFRKRVAELEVIIIALTVIMRRIDPICT
jgi:hypothetical protein